MKLKIIDKIFKKTKKNKELDLVEHFSIAMRKYRAHEIDDDIPLLSKMSKAPEVFYDDDIDKVKRLRKLYLHYKSNNIKNSNSDLWQDCIVPKFKQFYNALENDENLAMSMLNNLNINDLGYGFISCPKELYEAIETNDKLYRQIALLDIDSFICLAEYLGVLPVENPGQGVWGKSLSLDCNSLIDAMEKELGFELKFPAFKNGLYGIETKRGHFVWRHIIALYIALKIKKFFDEKGIKNPRICEIGGGLGCVAYYLDLLGIKDVTLFDIPSTSIVSSYFLMKNMPHRKFLLSDDTQTDKDAVKIYFDYKFKEFGADSFDMTINCDSFPEINEDIVVQYLKNIWKNSKYFYSVNQEANAPMWHSDKRQNIVRNLIKNIGEAFPPPPYKESLLA